MKRYFYVVLFLISPITVKSQEVMVGLNAGINRSNTGENYTFDSPASSGTLIRYKRYSRTGLNIGATIEYSASKWTYKSALSLVVKGDKSSQNSLDPQDQTHSIKSDLRINYLQVPFTALYQVKLAKVVILVGGGPYLALGLSGKSFVEGTLGDYYLDSFSRVKFGTAPGGDNYTYVNRTDVGLNGQVGVNLLKNTNLSAMYEHSLSSKYRIFGMNLGYRLFALKKTQEVNL